MFTGRVDRGEGVRCLLQIFEYLHICRYSNIQIFEYIQKFKYFDICIFSQSVLPFTNAVII